MTNTDLPELDGDALTRIEEARRSARALLAKTDRQGHRALRFAADCAIGSDSDLISYARNQVDHDLSLAQTIALLWYFNVMTYEYFVVTPVLSEFETVLNQLGAKARCDFPGSTVDLEPQRKNWVSRAAGRKILQEAKGGHVNITYWQDLQARFHALACPHLCAVPGNGWWHLAGFPNEPFQRHSFVDQLQLAIHRAVAGLNFTDQSVEEAVWLDRLSAWSPHYFDRCIANLPLASMEYCRALELQLTALAIEVTVPKAAAVILQTDKLKPGPKRDKKTASKVLGIVKCVAGDQPWKTKLTEICEDLDREDIPLPKTWGKRHQLESWADAAQFEPFLVKKAITHRLKVAQT